MKSELEFFEFFGSEFVVIVAFVQNRVTSTLYIGLAQAAYRKQVLRILSQNPLHAAGAPPPGAYRITEIKQKNT